MTAHDTQSFFTPDEFSRQQTRLLSQTYNLAHVLLNRSQSDHLFVPIRSLQYLAIIDRAKKLRLAHAADYLVMAAWLAFLKSKLLLPADDDSDEPFGEELAAQLAHRLRRL